ncbi:hypothetical protein ABZV67_21955 [Streptomyces sp. NPDC005065]|uniref:hypothetical protein n=1 Tax=Streptomyces sp. NPDC005065 TaxID=3154461 RepID=UPI0033B019A3
METRIIMMATGQTRGALPGTELWVRARFDVRSEVDLALQLDAEELEDALAGAHFTVATRAATDS